MQVVSQALLKSQQRNLVMSECVQAYALATAILQFKTLKTLIDSQIQLTQQ